MRTVDFHAHFFGPGYFRGLAGLSPLPGTAEERVAAVAARAGIEAPTDVAEHARRWLAELDRHGVEHAALFASLPGEADDVALAAQVGAGRFSTFALVDPRAEGAPARIRALAARGFRGVLAFPALHHYDPSGPEARAAWEALSESRGIAYVHCGLLVVRLRDLFGLPRTQDLRFADPLALIPAANAFPRVRFVVPHFGAGRFRETLLAAAQCENVYVDSSSSNSWRAADPSVRSLAEVFERALGVLGPRRVLFGTDSGTFPAGWRAERREEQLAALAAIGAPREDVERIFAGNAQELLGLARAEAGARPR